MERFKTKSLDRLFLLHPDPWPKNRHHKRRFIQTETLDEIARLLKPDAEFRMATDHPELATWLLEKTYFHPAFTWSATSALMTGAPFTSRRLAGNARYAAEGREVTGKAAGLFQFQAEIEICGIVRLVLICDDQGLHRYTNNLLFLLINYYVKFFLYNNMKIMYSAKIRN